MKFSILLFLSGITGAFAFASPSGAETAIERSGFTMSELSLAASAAGLLLMIWKSRTPRGRA